MNKDKQQNQSLKSSVLSRIEAENVCPKSRLFFQSRECFVWFFWFLSILIGSLAVAVSLFVMSNYQFALYEATHNNFFTFVIDFLPYLWLFLFGLMLFIALYNFRHTSRGYRYSVVFIVTSSLVLSVVGGVALQFLGTGFQIDKTLGENMKMYESQARLEQKMWQEPTDGRLMGRQVLSTLSPTTTVIFEDVTGQRWQLLVAELDAYDMKLLNSQNKVKIIGKVVDGNLYSFHACGAFPLLADKRMPADELSKERQRFVDRVYQLAERGREVNRLTDELEETEHVLARKSPCAEIRPVKNMNP